MVVVVVIDVVFVKKNVRSKKNLVEKIHVQKNFRQKIFGSKRVWSRKVVVQKNVVQNFKTQKNFGPKKNLSPKNFGYKIFWKKYLALKKVKKNVGPTFKVWSKLTQ